jgi:ABC-type branched-subunit amino acid transport system permease subunit
MRSYIGPLTRFGLAVAAVACLLDQASKLYLLFAFDLTNHPLRLGPYFDFVLTRNTGISYGLFQTEGTFGQAVLLAVKALAVVLLWVWLTRAHNRLTALALGLNIVVGLAGLLDLGYAAFFAIGAYTYGVAASWQVTPEWTSFWETFEWLGMVARFHETTGDVVHFQVSFWLMMPVAAALTAFFGLLFGAPTLRLKGDYLAIVTLGFGEIVPIVVRNTPSVTNGAMGLNGVMAPPLLLLIVLLGADKTVMKKHVSGKLSLGLTGLATAFMTLAAIAMFVTIFVKG